MYCRLFLSLGRTKTDHSFSGFQENITGSLAQLQVQNRYMCILVYVVLKESLEIIRNDSRLFHGCIDAVTSTYVCCSASKLQFMVYIWCILSKQWTVTIVRNLKWCLFARVVLKLYS